MFNEYSAMGLVETTKIQLGSPDGELTEISAAKLKKLLQKFNYFPDKYRKYIWSFVLKLPNNVEEAKRFRQKAILPQVQNLCNQKGVTEAATRLCNSLIHWYAPLLNCDWLPQMSEKLTNAFPKSFTFCFEVAITLITNTFAEWISDMPGPPPDVLSRIDSILSFDNPEFRDALNSGLVAWPAYRSIFSDILYERPWLELMDYILLSEPQFIEYCIIAWLEMNEAQVRMDHETFNAAPRPAAIPFLIRDAIALYQRAPYSTHSFRYYKPLSKGFYPRIEGNNDAVVLRTLQSDQDRLAALQTQLEQEKKLADETERIKFRKQQTFDNIEKLHEKKANEEKLQTSRAAAQLEKQMKMIRLESVRLKQAEEKNFIDQWRREWAKNIDFSMTSMQAQLGQQTNKFTDIIEKTDEKLNLMLNMRDADNLIRETRRISISRGRHARAEIEAQVHNRIVHNEVNKLASNPELLSKAPKFKATKKDD